MWDPEIFLSDLDPGIRNPGLRIYIFAAIEKMLLNKFRTVVLISGFSLYFFASLINSKDPDPDPGGQLIMDQADQDLKTLTNSNSGH